MIEQRQIIEAMNNDTLAECLDDIATVMRQTLAMPKAAEAVSEAARRIGLKSREAGHG